MMGSRSLVTLDEALHLDHAHNGAYHRQHLNPRHAALWDLVGLSERFTRASGIDLWDDQGNHYIDFLSGYAALSLGHNHPVVCDALERVKNLPNLMEGWNSLAAALAHNLAVLAPGALQRVYFANSGAEAVDGSLKLVRAATGRKVIVACHGSFHGRTIGALSVTQRPDYRDPFGPLLPDVTFVPYGDAAGLEQVLRHNDVAGFIVEPIQCEAGIIVPPPGYLSRARELCTRYGALLIADEVQTGLGRTGKLFAVNHEHVVPDVLLLGKALGGGLMPVSAVLTTDAIFRAAQGDTARTPFHTSTFGGNPRACAAGIATLDVLTNRGLVERSAELGDYLLHSLRALQERHPLIADVRGRGLAIGIEFAPGPSGVSNLLTGGIIQKLSHTYFAGYVITELVQKHHIITLNTLHSPNVLRLEPPFVVEHRHMDRAVAAIDDVLQGCRSVVPLIIRNAPRLARALRA